MFAARLGVSYWRKVRSNDIPTPWLPTFANEGEPVAPMRIPNPPIPTLVPVLPKPPDPSPLCPKHILPLGSTAPPELTRAVGSLPPARPPTHH